MGQTGDIGLQCSIFVFFVIPLCPCNFTMQQITNKILFSDILFFKRLFFNIVSCFNNHRLSNACQNASFFVDNLKNYPVNYTVTVEFGLIDPKNARNYVSQMFLSLL